MAGPTCSPISRSCTSEFKDEQAAIEQAEAASRQAEEAVHAFQVDLPREPGAIGIVTNSNLDLTELIQRAQNQRRRLKSTDIDGIGQIVDVRDGIGMHSWVTAQLNRREKYLDLIRAKVRAGALRLTAQLAKFLGMDGNRRRS